MRINTDTFDEYNDSKSQQPRFVIEIDFSTDGTDLHYFTSHSDIPTVTPVTHGVLKKTSSISQKLAPERANSTIGSLTFDLLDSADAVTTVFNDKRVNRKVLFGKRVRLYLGFAGMDWADYRLEQTQFIDKKLKFKDGVYSISCKDSTYGLNKKIMEPLETRLSASIVAADTTIPVYNVDGWELVERDTDFSDAPSTSCNYLEISDGKTKEYCRITAIGSDFTVDRGVLGTDAVDWILPADANDEKGPKVSELIFVEMSSLKLAYAVMTGELIGQAGTFPEHWHAGIDSSLLTESEFTNQDDFIAYAVGLQKTDAKKFIESEVMLPNSRYLRVNGSGGMDLKRLFAINSEAAPVFSLDETQITKFSDLEFDSADTYNKFAIEWSYDTKPKKPEYRRKSTFKFSDSVTDYGEQEKSFKFRLINGVRATTTTLLNLINSFADRLAGEAARLKVSTFSSKNNIEVGDVGLITHSGIKNFNTGGTLSQSMQVISTKADQVKGEFSVELFGSTFTPEPLTDGTVRVLNDSFYTAEANPLPNVVSNSLNADTTLTGGDNHNNFVFEVDGDLTIPDGTTLTITDNVQLRVKGQLTVLGTIDCSGNGRTTGGGFVGSSIGHFGSRCVVYPVQGYICSRTNGQTNQGQYEACPTFDLDNPDGLSFSGVPNDLRGSAGALGGASTRLDQAGDPIELSAGGTGNNSGSACVVVCRGMSLSGNGLIKTSGVAGNAATSDGDSTGGHGGHSTPGAFVVLLDGGTSSIPDLVGRVEALSYDPSTTVGKDIKQNAARVQFIPQARVAVNDEDIPEIADGIDGVDGQDGLGSLPIAFAPGVIGGAGDFIFTLDSTTGGADNVGEIRIQGSRFIHPDGTERTVSSDAVVNTEFGEGAAGRFYLVWSDQDTTARFVGRNAPGSSTQIFPMINDNGTWKCVDNIGGLFDITIVSTDCIIAAVEAETTTSGLTGIVPFVSGAAGRDGVDGTDGADGIDGSNGSDGSDGNTVAQISIHRRSASAPSTPTGGSYNFTTNTITPPTSWFTNIPSGTDPVYTCYAIASITGTTGTDSSITWSDPEISFQNGADGTDGGDGSDGSDGRSIYQATVFMRSATAPAAPADDSASYNFGTNTLTPPSSWFQNPPAGSNPLYATTATFSIIGTTGTDSTQTWSTPELFVQDGSDGANGIDGIDGADGLGSLPISFSPGFMGGAGDFVFTLDALAGGAINVGEIRVQGSRFLHPDGTERTVQADTQVNTDYGEGFSGRFYLMWSDEARSTRFAAGANWGTSDNVIPVRVNSAGNGWEAFDNAAATLHAFTPLATDCIIAAVEAETTTSGLTGIVPFVAGASGLDGSDGSDGTDGTDGQSTYHFNIYRRSASTPSTPTGGSFNFGTNTATAPTNWSTTIPAGTDPIYVSSALASVSGDTGTDSSLTWATPQVMAQNGADGIDGADGQDGSNGSDGSDGVSTAQLTIYRRLSSTPGTPTGGSYSFTSNTITPPTSWNSTIPAGSDPVYSSHAIASIVGTSGTDSSITWSTPELILENGQDGSDGTNGTDGGDGSDGRSIYQATVFRRSASAPSTPAANSASYDFGTNTLTPPTNWFQNPPAGSNPLYATTATFSIIGTTGTDSTQTWSTPELFVQDGGDGTDGDDGVDGRSTYFFSIYRRSASAPSTPTGGSFNFGTNTPTAPTNWNTSIPAGDDPLYVSSALASVSGDTGTDSSLTWSSPVVLAQDGEDGLGADPILNSTNDPITGVSHTSVGNAINVTWAFRESANGFSGSGDPPTGNITVSLRRNSTTIDSVVVSATSYSEPGFWNWNYTTGAGITISDTPGSGTHTYSVSISGDTSTDSSSTSGTISTREEQ